MTNNDIIIHFSQEGKAMNKRFVKRLLVFFTVLCMTMAMTVPALAAGSGTNATTDDPANGILQVMLAYVDDGVTELTLVPELVLWLMKSML